jgi:hypothetical protein
LETHDESPSSRVGITADNFSERTLKERRCGRSRQLSEIIEAPVATAPMPNETTPRSE